MTIYSGFPTRKLEERYNNLITETFQLLSQLIITYVQRSKIQPFEKHFLRLYSSMEKMDALKHLQPKFSLVLRPLNEHIFLLDQRNQTVPQILVYAHSNNQKKRPMTSNNFVQERRQSIQLERKTINVIQNQGRKTVDRYGQTVKNKTRHHSFSVKHSGNQIHLKEEIQLDAQVSANVTMEELMQKNRLVQRKLTLFRKKRHLQPAKFGKIQELEEEEDPSYF